MSGVLVTGRGFGFKKERLGTRLRVDTVRQPSKGHCNICCDGYSKEKLMGNPKTSPTFDVGIDLDGCVYDFVTVLGDFAAGYHDQPRRNFPGAQSWEFFKDQWGWDLDTFLDTFSAGVLAGHVLWQGTPFPTVVDTWNQLRADGHRLHVITDRSPRGAVNEAQHATMSWLASHGLEFDTLTFSPDKTKLRTVASGSNLVFIEDRVENVQALTAAGVTTFCQARPWNEGHDFDYVESFAEFGTRIDSLVSV